MNIAMCTICSMDTAGNHEWNCPNKPAYLHNYQTFVPFSHPITDEEAEKIKISCADCLCLTKSPAEAPKECKHGNKASNCGNCGLEETAIANEEGTEVDEWRKEAPKGERNVCPDCGSLLDGDKCIAYGHLQEAPKTLEELRKDPEFQKLKRRLSDDINNPPAPNTSWEEWFNETTAKVIKDLISQAIAKDREELREIIESVGMDEKQRGDEAKGFNEAVKEILALLDKKHE